jgi:hypothetical protein
MEKIINKKILILLSLSLLLSSLFSGCFLAPPINQPPTITSIAITSATEEEAYNYNVSATDPDVGDTLIYSLTTKPTGMTIDSATGVINWTPTSADIGNHDVTVKVSDGNLYDTQSFMITVSEIPIVPPSPSPSPSPGTDATLSALTISAGTLTPAFASGTTSYTAVLPYGTATLPTVTLATPTDPNATRVITQPVAVDGSATIVVTAEDGTTTLTYSVDFSVAAGPVHNITQGEYYSTITAAFDDSTNLTDGDVIEVSDGTYNENITFPASMVITLRSVSGASSTTITGDDYTVADATVECSNSLDGTILQGFTITHTIGDIGIGIYLHYDSDTTNFLDIIDCTITGNDALVAGGGIVNEGILTITDSTISDNTAPDSGGGIKNEGVLTITGSTISGNTATSEHGGGIWNTKDPTPQGVCVLTITGSTISGNTANFGGGISNQGTLTVDGASTISGNDAVGYGGGIYNSDGGSASTLVTGGSTISGNTASGPTGKGGGIYTEDELTVTGSFISDNEAFDAGGIYIYDNTDVVIGGNSDTDTANFNTFTDNYKTGDAPSADQHLRYVGGDAHLDYPNNTFDPNL